MKAAFLYTSALLAGFTACSGVTQQSERQYAAYTLRPETAVVSGYTAIGGSSDRTRLFGVTAKNELYELNDDLSRGQFVNYPAAQTDRISSLMMSGGRLYVGSWSDANGKNVVFSLDADGTGKTVQIGNGSYSYTHDAANGSGPWHPQHVYAGTAYVYVAATGQNVRVYRLADMLAADWKNTAEPFCYLKLNFSVGKGNRISMQERNGDIFISSDSADGVCRFNTGTFRRGTAAQAAAPEQTVSRPIRGQRVRAFTFGKTKAAAAAGSAVYIYELPDFLSYSFDAPLIVLSAPDGQPFDKIRGLYGLTEDAGVISFTVQADWGIVRYAAAAYPVTERTAGVTR